MSTKTSIKRIALVAVSALGFGLLSVVPARAAAAAIEFADGSAISHRTDAASASTFTIQANGAQSLADTKQLDLAFSRNSVAISGVPSGITINWDDTQTSVVGNASAEAGNVLSADMDVANFADNAAIAVITVGTTMAPGVYTVTMTPEDTLTVSNALTFYVSTAPTTLSLDKTSYAMDTTASTPNAVLTIKDVQGNPTYLIPGEALDVTVTGGVTGATKPTVAAGFLDAATAPNTATTRTIDLETSSATAGTYTLTVARASGMTGLASVTASIVVGAAPSAATGLTISSGTYVNADGTGDSTFDGTGDLTSDAANRVAYVSTAQKSLTFVAATSATSGVIRFVVATHGSGLPAGVTASTATDVAIVDNGASASPRYTASLTLTAIAPAAGFGYDVSTAGGTARGFDVTYQAPVANSVTTVDPLLDGGSISALTGSTNSFEVVVYDQFGVELPNAAVTFTTSSRNANNKGDVTGAAGSVSYSYTDASTSTTTLADTVTATINGTGGSNGMPAADNTVSMTINYKSSITVATATISGNTSTTSATANSIAYANAITSGTSSVSLKTNTTALAASGSANVAAIDQAVVKVVLKDALGNVVPGVRVTFTGSAGVFFAAAGSASLTSTASIVPVVGATAKTSADVYSDSNGEAYVQARFTKTGTGTVKAVAYGTSSSDLALKVVNAAADARSIAAVASALTSGANSNPVATYKVTDGFGNAVSGVDVKFTVSGVGTFLNGTNSVTGTTDTDGLVTVAVASNTAGSATVTATVTTSSQAASEAAAVTALGFAAAVKSATAAVTFAGGSPAEVAAAEAAEAALEAIDAANAAFDAANIAAEAADAATVAAEEARDAADAATAAVEELATQVATLMAALKAQITTLANTVAKIAKKVSKL